MKAQTTAEKNCIEAVKTLRKLLKPGTTVYAVLRWSARSGMSRGIDFYIVNHGAIRWITAYVGHAIGHPQTLRDWRESRGLRIDGCGMDSAFEVVYNLGRALYPKGFIPAKCGAYGRNGKPATERDEDGGYALNSCWL